MNIQERKNKDGIITSYRVRVFSHRDTATGAQKFKNLSVKYDNSKSELWNRKNAEKQGAIFENSVEELTVTTSTITFDEYARYVTETKYTAGILRKSTAYGQGCKRKRAAPFVGHIQLKHLTPNTLNRAYAEMLKADVPRKTVKEIHGFIHGVLTIALKEGVIPRNYASAAMPPKCERPRVVAMTEDELKAFFTALYSNQRHYEYQVLFTLMLATACRVGEICALQWKNIDFNECKIGIFQHYTQDGDGERIEEGGKTKTSVGWLYLDESVMQMLAEYRAYLFKKAQKYGSKWDYDTNAVFTTSHRLGGYISPHSVREWLRRFTTRHKLPHITPHQFRHTSISVQLDKGISIAEVSKRARHSRPDVTLSIYAHTMRNNDKHCCEAVTEILPTLPQARKV
jgi:integrase